MAININHQTNDISASNGSVTIDSSTVIAVNPGTSGNVLTSNGTVWLSQAPSSGGGGITTGKAIAMAIVFG